jgi:antiviral helicase SKI2
MLYPSIEILSGECLTKVKDPAITYPFECDHFQNHAFNSIENGNDVFVSVPTSGGKTIVGEYAIVHAIKKLNKKVIYTSPIKSLSNEKYNEFKTKFAPYGITVGLLTGDNKIDVDSDCLIVTAEILRNSLYQLKEKIEYTDRQINEEYVNDIGCVIMDEIHFMNDLERGKVWEETICMLSPSIQLVMLSATVSNPEKFVKWISVCHQKKVSLIIVTKRLIPLEHFIYINDKEYKFLDGTNTFNVEQYMTAKYEYESEIKI